MQAYNWDLLTPDPPLAFPELQRRFRALDARANAQKNSARKRGWMAVAFGAFSLMAASVAPLLNEHYETGVSTLAAVAGVVSIAIGVFGVLHAGAKRRWLELRYQTERLRQFHFQSTLALLPELLAALRDPVNASFAELRGRSFQQFCGLHLDGASERLGALLRDDDDDSGWLFGDLPRALPGDSETFRDFEQIYRHYRLDGQIDFCDRKLNTREGLRIPRTVAEQAVSFGAIALFCILGATVLHIISAGLPATGLPHAAKPWLDVAVLWLAVAVLAVRALEEGLRPQREVERYRQYRSALRAVKTRLDTAATPAEKIAAMKQLEEVSFAEMVNFLQDNDHARFIM